MSSHVYLTATVHSLSILYIMVCARYSKNRVEVRDYLRASDRHLQILEVSQFFTISKWFEFELENE